MARILLTLPRKLRESLWSHLLPRAPRFEEVAFVFARHEGLDGRHLFKYVNWVPVRPDGFVSRSAYHLELSDDVRASAIKQAHDLGTSLIEFHSHVGPWPAEFSPSDLHGFDEFVPHVWWRLKGRPYLAVVVAPSGFDALAWITGPREPQRLDQIVVGREALTPTALTRLTRGPQ